MTPLKEARREETHEDWCGRYLWPPPRSGGCGDTSPPAAHRHFTVSACRFVAMGRCWNITRILLRAILALGVALLLLALFCSTTVRAAKERRTPLIHTVNGAEIFQDFCASCHGREGRGDGPVAPALRFKVPDLTQISKRAGGRFPTARIRSVIEGTETGSEHRSREMPIWGPVFHQIVADQDLGAVRTANVTSYINIAT